MTSVQAHEAVAATVPPAAEATPPPPAAAEAADAAPKALVGLIGAGIQRSLSPALHEAEARAQGLRLHYQLIDLDRAGASDPDTARRVLPGLLAAARTMGFAGLNITYPCKQAVIPLLDALSPQAEAMGAVNTVVFGEDGRATGHNTDGSGWRWGFERALPHADLSCVVLLGTGGAGSAIAHALHRMPVGELRLVDSDPARAQALAARLAGSPADGPDSRAPAAAAARVRAFERIEAALDGASGIVHATPTGMDKLPGLPLPAALLRPPLWVAEIVYFPLHTELLRAARAAGCATVDGGTMAVGQAADAFRLFTGRAPDVLRMDAHFRRLVTAPHAAAVAAPPAPRPPHGAR